MVNEYIVVEQSLELHGEAQLVGAKNAVLVIMTSLILADGVSTLTNVPRSNDVFQMILLLESLGAHVTFDEIHNTLTVDTSTVNNWHLSLDIMKKMRASILVLGPLLARFGRAEFATPGGCTLGRRPIDYHIKGFERMGVLFEDTHNSMIASCDALQAKRIILEYPSVGATENFLMAATLTKGTTEIINAALEPEVYDLIAVLQKMGAQIAVSQPAMITIQGVECLNPVTHEVMVDRLEAGTLLIATAITGGSIHIPNAQARHMDLVLYKLEEMGHAITMGQGGLGIALQATKSPKAVSFKTTPYPGFPTDLQAPMMALQCLADGVSVIEETVFESRLQHIPELVRMGARIEINNKNKATVTGVDRLIGASVEATDIRASCALVLAGLAAEGSTIMSNTHHFKRGYESLDEKLRLLGGKVRFQ